MTKFEQTPAMQQIYRCLGASMNESLNRAHAADEHDKEIKPQSLMTFDGKGLEKVAEQQIAPAFHQAHAVVDMRKQKLQRYNQQRQLNDQDLLNKLSDDFDQLTNKVKVKKLKEYLQKRNDENKRNPLNDKKNQSTAYRPTNLPAPKPTSGRTP